MKIRINGANHELSDLDERAHAILHGSHSTDVERGMANTIMALCEKLEAISRPGYAVTICSCDYPYVGARKLGTPDCCEVCGFMTPDQYAAIILRAEQ